MTANRGKLLLGAKPIARHAFKDEKRWRSLYNGEMQRELGLFMLGRRVAGYTGVIDSRLNAKVAGALAAANDRPPRKAAATATIAETTI
jgi:hypothetical protein